jgi:integrase
MLYAFLARMDLSTSTPLSAAQVADFLLCATLTTRSSSDLPVLLSTANAFSLQLGGEAASAKTEPVRSMMRSLQAFFRPVDEPQSAAPLSWEHLRAIGAHLARSPSFKSAQLWAWLCAGYFGVARGGELAAARWADLTIEPAAARLIIRLTKTHRTQVKEFLPHSDANTCPVAALRDYSYQLHLGGASREAPLFPVSPRSSRARTLASLAADTRAILAHMTHLPTIHFTGHSLRRGGATALHEAGASTLDLRAAGGWNSAESVVRYVQTQPILPARIFQANAAGVSSSSQ